MNHSKADCILFLSPSPGQATKTRMTTREWRLRRKKRQRDKGEKRICQAKAMKWNEEENKIDLRCGTAILFRQYFKHFYFFIRNKIRIHKLSVLEGKILTGYWLVSISFFPEIGLLLPSEDHFPLPRVLQIPNISDSRSRK